MTIYNEQLAEEICTRMALGETLTTILAGEGMPSDRTVLLWRRTHPDFDVAYIKAREDQMHAWGDQIVGLMDRAIPDKIELDKNSPILRKYENGEKIVLEVDGKHLSHVREMIKTRQWVMAKIAPHHWGDKQTIHNTYSVEHKDDAELVADLREALNKSGMTPEDLVALLTQDREVTE